MRRYSLVGLVLVLLAACAPSVACADAATADYGETIAQWLSEHPAPAPASASTSTSRYAPLSYPTDWGNVVGAQLVESGAMLLVTFDRAVALYALNPGGTTAWALVGAIQRRDVGASSQPSSP